MVEKTDKYIFIWDVAENGSAVLYRMYSKKPVAVLPEAVGDKKIEMIAPYCFASNRKLTDTDVCDEIDKMYGNYHEFAGDYIENISLPDTLKKIGNNAFYNCRNMSLLEMGTDIDEVGSDVFMNCRSFRRMTVRGSSQSDSGVSQMLSRYSSELEVCFECNGQTEAKLLYPEYFESYDEISPAHIFGRNIEGEGFRARQCFDNGKIVFSQYDSVFSKASAEESVTVASRMAVDRLMYPVGLDTCFKNEYQEYVRKNQGEIMEIMVRNRSIDELEYMCSSKIADSKELDHAMTLASQEGWHEGTACMIEWKHKYDIKEKDRYDFSSIEFL